MKNKRGETALLFSLIKSKDLNDISKYLLEKGGKLDDSTSKYIDLCLRKAVGNCNLNLIKHLVELGADIHKENKSKQTPIFFVGHGSDRLEVLKYLIGQGANINHQDKEGTTLLQEAALDEPELVEFLLNNGADVNVKNNMGCTPLLNAVGNVPSSERCADRNLEEIVERQMNIVKCLVEHGANVNDRDITGQTPIFGSPNIHITKYLIEKGADVNAVDLSGQTLLFDKISTINAIGFREFMEIGININIQDCRGYTVLHEAVEKRTANLLGGVCFTDFMISHGADPYLRTNSGLTAIELADSLGRNTLFQGHFRNNASQSEQDTIQPQVNPPPVIDSDEEIEEQEIEIDSDAYFTDDEMDIFLQENNTRLEQLSMQGIRFRIGRRRGRLVIILQE